MPRLFVELTPAASEITAKRDLAGIVQHGHELALN